jgi:hypothetical protein
VRSGYILNAEISLRMMGNLGDFLVVSWDFSYFPYGKITNHKPMGNPWKSPRNNGPQVLLENHVGPCWKSYTLC